MKKYHQIERIEIRSGRIFLTVDGIAYQFNLSEFSEKLANANEIERNTFEISPSGYGIHWPLIDEDVSIDGLLKIPHRRPSLGETVSR